MNRRFVIQSCLLGGCALLVCTHLLAENKDSRREQRDEVLPVERSESLSTNQKKLYREFTEARETANREQTAQILSDLWREERLRTSIKNGLADRHYRLELRQLDDEYQRPSFDVRCSQTFPFPDVWTHFTPTLYINGEVVWAPKKPQRSHAMSLDGSSITSRTGGSLKNGDIVQYQIRLHHEVDQEVVWQRTLWTNRVVVAGLSE